MFTILGSSLIVVCRGSKSLTKSQPWAQVPTFESRVGFWWRNVKSKNQEHDKHDTSWGLSTRAKLGLCRCFRLFRSSLCTLGLYFLSWKRRTHSLTCTSSECPVEWTNCSQSQNSLDLCKSFLLLSCPSNIQLNFSMISNLALQIWINILLLLL